MRLFWSLLGCATALWTIAEVICGYYALILNVAVPVASWADVGYLAAIPFVVAALIAHPAARGSGTRKARSLFDGLIVAAALLFLSWTLVLGPLWRNTNVSTLGGVVALAYPCGDVVIVFFIVLALRRKTRDGRLSLWCLLAGLLAMAVTDSSYADLTGVTSYTSPGLIDTGWVAAYLGIALAAFTAEASTGVELRVESPRPSLVSLISPLVPVLLALGVIAVEIRLGHHLDQAAWLIALGLVVLVLARQALILLELFAPGRTHGGLTPRLEHAALETPPTWNPSARQAGCDEHLRRTLRAARPPRLQDHPPQRRRPRAQRAYDRDHRARADPLLHHPRLLRPTAAGLRLIGRAHAAVSCREERPPRQSRKHQQLANQGRLAVPSITG